MSRLWRGRILAWSVGLVSFALIAATCGDGESETTVASTESPAETAVETTTTTTETTTTTAAPEPTTTVVLGPGYGGEAVIGQDQEPPTLNPLVPGGDNAAVTLVGQQYLVGVYDIDGSTLELVPELVTELPTVGNGGVVVNEDDTMTVTYTIREEAVWADGVPISGDDFQFTLDIHVDPDLPTDKTLYNEVIGTEIGEKTFSFTMAEPTVRHELMFDYVLPKHDVEESDFVSDWNDSMWVSGGPFVFESWDLGESLTVVRNDNYWKEDEEGNQLPYLDGVTTRFIPETASLITALEDREVDVIRPQPSTEAVEAMQPLEREGAVVEVLTGPFWEHLNFQFGPGRLEQNPDSANESLTYRRAVAHAIDKDLIVDEILAGQVAPLDSFVDPFWPGLSQDAWAQYEYDVEGAISLVEEAKVELGRDNISTVFSTTSNNDARVRMSELLVDMFDAVGIAYEPRLEPSELFFGETLLDGNWDLGEWAWSGSPGFSGLINLMEVFDPDGTPPEGQNYYRWGTPDSVLIDDNTARFAVIRDELNATVDEREIVPLINEAEQILADQLVIVPLYARLDAAAYWGDELAGFEHNPSEAGFTWNIEEWYRVDR